jgi:tetratricopeptide (TPR) repeat protein
MHKNAAVVSLVNQATIALTQRDYSGTLDAYASALKIAKELKRSRLIAVLLNRTGKILQAKGQVQDAVIAYESALRALEGEIDLDLQFVDRQLSQVSKGHTNNHSDSPYAINDPEPVPDLYSASVAASLEADENDATLVVKLWLDIGNAYLQQPQENPALNAYEHARKRPEIEKDLLLKAYALANIGEIYRRQDRIDEAETELNQAIQLFDRQADPLDKRRALALLASIARDRNQLDQAINLYQQALSLYEQANDQRGLGRTCAGLD